MKSVPSASADGLKVQLLSPASRAWEFLGDVIPGRRSLTRTSTLTPLALAKTYCSATMVACFATYHPVAIAPGSDFDHPVAIAPGTDFYHPVATAPGTDLNTPPLDTPRTNQP